MDTAQLRIFSRVARLKSFAGAARELSISRSQASRAVALGRNDSGHTERTEEKVAAWHQEMREWGATHDGADVLTQLSARMDRACAKDDCKNGLRT